MIATQSGSITWPRDGLFWSPNDDAPGLACDWNPNFGVTLGLDAGVRITLASIANTAPGSAGDPASNGNSSLQPTFSQTGWGGQYNWPAWTHNGTSQYLACSTSLAQSLAGGTNKEWSSVMAVRPNVVGGTVQALFTFCNTGTANPLWDFFINLTPNWVGQRRGDAGGAPAVIAAGTPVAGTKYIISTLYSNTGQLTVNVNGTPILSGAQVTGVVTFNVLAIGCTLNAGAAQNTAAATYARKLFWGRKLTGPELTAIEKRMTQYYLL